MPDLRRAIDAAREAGRRVAIKFDAHWCSQCVDLDRDVVDTASGRALFAEVELLRADFDDAATAPWVERFAVLDLPTVLVLDEAGQEVGRVVGYREPKSFVEELRQALVQEDPVPALERALAEAPGDAATLLALGTALLSRRSDDGEALLERLTWRDDAPEEACAALFALGRFRHRARKDPASARAIWRELAKRFPEANTAIGAIDWYARAQAELGQPQVGSAAFAAYVRAYPRETFAVTAWARFVGRQRLEDARAEVRAAAVDAAAQARGRTRDELEDLVLELSRPL